MESKVPLSNSTALQSEMFHGWMEVPLTRGTSDILYNCTLTIILCVYTAIHINIPAPSDSKWRQRLRLVKWTLVGILAPEFVLVTAGTQLFKARRVVEKMHDAQKTQTRFNLSYGFYVVMGGFRVHIIDSESGNPIDAALAPEAIIYLAKHGLIYHISEKTLQDRSKADVVTKVMATVQVTWLCIQCIARKIDNLPLSLLEIHTVTHCVCAAMVYCCWLYKPQNIEEATYISVPEAHAEHLKWLTLRSIYKADPASTTESETNAPTIPFESLGPRLNNAGSTSLHILKKRRGYLYQKIHDFGETLVPDDMRNGVPVIIWAMQLLYGVIHLLAWNWQFPTPVEQLLWRVSGTASIVFWPVVLVSSVPLVFLSLWWDSEAAAVPWWEELPSSWASVL